MSPRLHLKDATRKTTASVRRLRRVRRTGAGCAFVLRDDYFGRKRFEGVEERDGLRMEFAGWSQPLTSYAESLEDAGLMISSLREPLPEQGHEWRRFEKWTRVPLFLWLTARRA